MEIGQKVKIAGTKEIGTVTEKKEERIGTSTAKVIYTVTFDNGKSFEYFRDELRNVTI